MPINHESARRLLEDSFREAEASLLKGSIPEVSKQIREACEVLFRSRTQAYREVLLGCTIARIQDKTIDVRQPYADQGPNAFSGRSLDERVINPFLHEKRIPASRGPYLSVFRRSVQFNRETKKGLGDQQGYDAFLSLLDYLESTSDDSELIGFLTYLLYKFAQLREAAAIPLSRLQRISLEQYDTLVSGLLSTPSGGRFPVLVVVATFLAIKEFFRLNWEVKWQGINVADIARGAGGDVTVSEAGLTLMVAEVTERPVDRSRVVSTFNTKIAPAGIEDYLFFVKPSAPIDDAKQQARQYFSQGHEVNFLEIKNWILMTLATMGKRGRTIFNRVLTELLSSPDVPKALKVSWNEQIARIATGQD